MRYLLCFIPPLAVLSCGKPGQFLVSVGLTLCFYIPGFVHALGVVHNYYADKRTDRIVNAIGKSASGSGAAAQPQTAKGGLSPRLILYGVGFFAIMAAMVKVQSLSRTDKPASAEQAKPALTTTDKSAAAEQAKPAAKPDDKLTQYTIISEKKDSATKTLGDVRVRLHEKVSEDDLKRIAEKIRSGRPITGGLIFYYLPEQGQSIPSLFWARAEFKPKEMFKADPNPKLEIEIHGNPKGTLPPKIDGEIVGQWEWNAEGSFETLLHTKDGLKMISTEGKSGKTSKLSYLVTARKEGKRIVIRPIKTDSIATYWMLDEDKNLLLMDSEDNKPMDKLVAIVKPVLTLDGSNEATPSKETGTISAFATADEAKSEAIRLYPDLAIAGSAFNREFLAQYKRYQQERPSFFNDTSWPIRLAEETSKSVSGGGGNSRGGATPASKTVK